MRRLLLMRHAKSSWDVPNIADFDRPLNARGLKTAPFMGVQIYKNCVVPDLIISSTAKRAKHTAILVRETGGIENKIIYDDRIYEASPTTLLSVVSEIDEKYKNVLLIGHNPGLESFIRILTGAAVSMPTGGVTKITFETNSWKNVLVGSGTIERILHPRDLMKETED